MHVACGMRQHFLRMRFAGKFVRQHLGGVYSGTETLFLLLRFQIAETRHVDVAVVVAASQEQRCDAQVALVVT